MKWTVKGCPMRAAQRLGEALRINAPGCGAGAFEVLAVIAQQPSTMAEIAAATGSSTGPVCRRLKWLRPHLSRDGELVNRPPLVVARQEPGSRAWRYELTPQGEELLRQAGYEKE